VRKENNLADSDIIPAELVTSSGSGLDPDISLEGAYLQVERVATERGMTVEQVKSLIERHAKRPYLGFLGEKRVNVLELNLELDKLSS
jgi:K+-transporting ATPase ATPase C chain